MEKRNNGPRGASAETRMNKVYASGGNVRIRRKREKILLLNLNNDPLAMRMTKKRRELHAQGRRHCKESGQMLPLGTERNQVLRVLASI